MLLSSSNLNSFTVTFVFRTLLANQFRLMYQANILAESGMDSGKIAGKLKEHPYRVTLALRESLDIEEKKILNMLESLYFIVTFFTSSTVISFSLILYRYSLRKSRHRREKNIKHVRILSRHR